MGNEFDFMPKVERGECSLAELIRINYQMEETIGKRRRAMWIILGVLAAIGVALAAYVGLHMLDPRAGNHDRQFAIMLGVVSLVTMLAFAPAIGIALYRSTIKPAKRYQKALQAGYPGIDASSEAAIKSYVWNYAGDPGKLLDNLSRLIVVHGDAARDHVTSAEQVVLDLWMYAPRPYRELYDLQLSEESEMVYLANLVNSCNAIGATDEADAWLEVRELFAELEIWDFEGEQDEDPMIDPDNVNWARHKSTVTGEYIWLWGVDEYGDVPRAFTEEQRTRFLELEERIAACHDDTQDKLYDFVMQNRILFGFEGAGQTM